MSMFAVSPKFTPLTDDARLSMKEGASIAPSASEISLNSESMSGRETISRADMVAGGSYMRGQSPADAVNQSAGPLRQGMLHYPTPFSPEQLRQGLSSLQRADYGTLTYEVLTQGNIVQLNETYQTNRVHLLETASTFQSHLGTFGLSGRGQNDLNKILSEKKGTYGDSGSLMVIGVSRPQNLNAEAFLNNLAEAAHFATGYSVLQNSARVAVDPIPGGIIVTQLPFAGVNTFSEKGSAVLYPNSPLCIGESAIKLNPLNFENQVRGVIPFSNYASFVEAANYLSSEMRGIHDPSISSNAGYINYYNNELYPRANLIQRLAADFVTAQALSIFAERNEIR